MQIYKEQDAFNMCEESNPIDKQHDDLNGGPSLLIEDTNELKDEPVNEKKEESPQQRPPHPYANASLLSRLFFAWPWPLLKLGLQRPLSDMDLADVMHVDSSQRNLDHFRSIWDPTQPGKDDMHWALLKDLLKTTWYVQPMFMATMAAKIAQALFLGELVDSFERGGKDNKTYFWAMGIVCCACVSLFEHHHAFFFLWRTGAQFRVACVAAIYEKALRLSSTHPETLASNGRIMNLASNDVERFMHTCLFISFLFWAPLQVIGIMIVGALLVGPAFLAGIALLVFVFVPLQMYLSRQFAHYRSTIAALTDERVTLVSQAIRGARVMKMSGYEQKFLQRIQVLREREVNQLVSAVRLKAANEALFFVTNIVVSVVVFLVQVFTGNVLKPGDVFTVFTLVNVMQLELTKHASIAIMATSECYVSINRIQEFLEFPEIPTEPDSLSLNDSPKVDDDPSLHAISMMNVSCRWSQVKQIRKQNGGASEVSSNHFAVTTPETPSSRAAPMALEDVTVDFPHGTLTAVVGPVGSGKSALLQVLVRELVVASGSIRRNYKTLAYASQDAWIMDGTIQENILMGLGWAEDWYNQVVRACSLSLDFQQLRDGDQTVVGDRGVQLSGGQRARIGLARALYKNADVLIADDPLSAVDARVGRHLFQQAIMGMCVNRGKCVVLATHQHQYITDVRCLLVFGGRIKCIGTYEECVEASAGKLTAHDADTTVDSLPEQPTEKNAVSTSKDTDDTPGNEEGEIGDDVFVSKFTKPGLKKEQEEKNLQGAVNSDTYLNYMKAAGGLWVGIFLLGLFVCTQGSVLVTVASMGRWAETDPEDQKEADIVATVVGMSVLVVMLSVIRAFLTLELALKASRSLHDRMAEAVIRARIEFFDTNPLGRILNRFSADIGIADDLLPQTLFDVLVIGFVVLGAVITALTTLPYALVVIPFLVWYFTSVRKIFVTSTRELKRLEGLARSPIFAMLSEALGGIATIRANGYIPYFLKKFQVAHDAHTRTFFAFISSSRWVGFRMDSLVFVFLTVVCFLAVLVQNEGWFNVDPSILGLSISMLLYLSASFQWCIRQSAEVVNQMVSVERVLEYGKVEPEADLHHEVDDKLASRGWPTAGEIEYDGVSVRYRSTLPLALHKVSFHIPAGARVGVVGRTGSGKSTIVQTLFRLLEPEEGRILIDGEDVGKLGLHALRTEISVIPQVPTLFSGCSVRENLDLFQLHDDDEINRVLDSCHLKDVIADLPNGWNSIISEGGSNFSVGQRQLLCLARAILSKNKILVLDEATASVDRRTDQLLQQTLQESYHDGTILAVAHRLDTVIDYDYILVLGHGEVVEFGSPGDLLSKKDGVFSRMVNDTGDAMSKSLNDKAKFSILQKIGS